MWLRPCVLWPLLRYGPGRSDERLVARVPRVVRGRLHMGTCIRVTGAVLVYCGSRRTLAVPVGWFRYRCSRCGLIFKGSE